ENADLVLYVVDAHAGVAEEDEDFLRVGRGERLIAIRAKADLVALAPPAIPFKEDPSPFPFSEVTVSAVTGAGLDALRAAIAARLGLVEAEGELLVLARHKEALESAARLLAEAGALAAEGSDAELVASRAREGLVALGAITGETATEDLLDRIFSTFCVGK
ncbi:MAG: tRNA uridine-5-carboxymethylaminomethyl(34) synthesis GTPase MnmE, partial [Acidobacteriota bacterium]